MTLPARVPAGRTAFTLENHGAEPHEVRFLRLAAPHTIDDFVTWQKSRSADSGVARPVGRHRQRRTRAEGGLRRHAGHGIVRGPVRRLLARRHVASGEGNVRLAQVEPGGVPAPAPDADLTVVLSDHHFLLSAPVTAGRPVCTCAIPVPSRISARHQAARRDQRVPGTRLVRSREPRRASGTARRRGD